MEGKAQDVQRHRLLHHKKCFAFSAVSEVGGLQSVLFGNVEERNRSANIENVSRQPKAPDGNEHLLNRGVSYIIKLYVNLHAVRTPLTFANQFTKKSAKWAGGYSTSSYFQAVSARPV